MVKKYLMIMLLLSNVSCQAQHTSETKYASINFLNYVNSEYVDILSATVVKDTETYDIALPYYEFPISKIKIGDACIFAVTKDLSKEWEIDAVSNPKGECNQVGDYYPSFYIACRAANLFTNDTASLVDNFNLYTFLIKKEDLKGPFLETSEDGTSEYYEIKESSKTLIFKYNKREWELIDEQKNNMTPRVFGETYINKLIYNANK